MTIDDIVNHFGKGQNETARMMGFDSAYFSMLKSKGGLLPIKVALVVDAMSKGKLKFDKKPYQNELLAKIDSKV